MQKILIILSMLGALGPYLNAQSITTWQFKSRFDNFELEQIGTNFKLAGRPIQLGEFKEFIELYQKEFVDPCNVQGKPDLTVVRLKGEDKDVRKFYVSEKIISDGTHCLAAGGEGLYYIPLHRSWFQSGAKEKISLQTPLKIKKDDQILAHLGKKANQWVNLQEGLYLNWDFFERVEKSLQEFKVSARLHSAAGADKPQWQLQSGRSTLVFYRLTPSLWAVKKPATGWLLASPDWGFFGDMTRTQWEDRHAPILQIIDNRQLTAEERLAALKRLEGAWSRCIKESLQNIMLDREAGDELKSSALQLMKNKPTFDNFGVLVKALRLTENAQLQQNITQVLRIRNPKGDVIKPDADLTHIEAVIRTWEQWWTQQKPE